MLKYQVIMTPTITNTDFAVKTDVFEGPLTLLIELVEKRKLLINDISLAAVTDDYIKQVSDMQERSLPHTTQFVQLAATLLLIKSKSLLPNLELTAEEEASIDDLEERLRQYQIYKNAGELITARFGKSMMFGAAFTPPRETLFLPDEWCSKVELHEAIGRVIANLPQKQIKPKVQVKAVVSLDEMMDNLRQRIEKQMRTSFSELREAARGEHKVVIVSFLAILELFKQGNVIVRQNSRFSDIEIELERGDTPRYY